jgi:hypothetical protein
MAFSTHFFVAGCIKDGQRRETTRRPESCCGERGVAASFTGG